ncbi:MAG TPA: type I DNA topoisomerase [Gaiellaceae bacterium]|jgi:DNA topoisomerase-1|nr:type I DNA topoisomerase [Gaiellaceae bacterium]
MAASTGKKLVIVESPAKAKTIAGYLGKDYVVESSIGHIRDLPNNAGEIPAKFKGEAWARLGVDVDHDFAPLYVVDSRKKKVVADLKAKLKNADELLLATDEDREGEAIAWHLREVLDPKVPVRRMVFHEITKPAIEKALGQTREINDNLVDAQETRRILDRLYGYEVSPVLWRKIMQGLSAGRVQSVATRLVVERERERMKFVAADYWDIVATYTPGDFTARLASVDGKRVAQGRDFERDGTLKTADAVQVNEADARALAEALEGAAFRVASVEEKPYTRRPAAPFMTSTLQQEASRKLRLSSQQTMRTAQRLYENGYITYMRTDSTTLSESALAAARDQARELYGAEFVPAEPRQYTRKVKNAQEAHEAIRPAGDRFRTPDDVKKELSGEEFNVYDLIWKRTVASQMADVRGQTVSVRIEADASDGRRTEFATAGTVITFRGFLLAYEEGRDDATDDAEEKVLPELHEGDALNATALEPEGHSTSPPARFTEASLVKALEERGIGRPSTYAAIMGTILDRGYVRKQGQALVPEFLAFSVVGLLERHFAQLVDYEFTARMEDDLDGIASGDEARTDWLQHFYFGEDGRIGLKEQVEGRLAEIDAREINTIELPGTDIVVRVGKYGPYLERGEDRQTLPPDIAPDELTPARAEELLALGKQEHELGADPETGRTIALRSGRYGPYVTEVVEGDEKPRTASLFKSMTPETVTLDEALRLLTLPRVVGEVDGEEVLAANGRYGPYVKRAKESRSLETEEQLFTITLEEALAKLAEPRARGRQAAPPLKELGDDPVSGKPILLKEGRFGPYVTDGETNASLRAGDSVESITPERAHELIQARREAGPAKKKPVKKRTSRKKT